MMDVYRSIYDTNRSFYQTTTVDLGKIDTLKLPKMEYKKKTNELVKPINRL